jgi:hypothetical protein
LQLDKVGQEPSHVAFKSTIPSLLFCNLNHKMAVT